MPTTNDAEVPDGPARRVVAPSKAVNAGGVATSALEMAQNSERLVGPPRRSTSSSSRS